MDDRITMDEVSRIAEKNPEAASLALAMQLMADSSDASNRIMNSILDGKDREIARLRDELVHLRPYAMKWLTFQDLLKQTEEYA